MAYSSGRGTPAPFGSAAGLPLLPGTSSFADPFFINRNFKKTHVFDVKNGVPVVRNPAPSAPASSAGPIDPLSAPAQRTLSRAEIASLTYNQKQPSSALSRSGSQFSKSFPSAGPVPAFVALDGKVLRFYAYFKETVNESAAERERVRKCIVYLYLEDETIHISEPKQDNSAIPQGAFLKRHRIPVPGTGRHYSFHDLNIGTEVNFYGRVLRITDCDAFTREFLEGVGVSVPASEDAPADIYSTQRVQADTLLATRQRSAQTMEEKRYLDFSAKGRHCKPSGEELQSSLRFFANDRKVLSFNAVWDDRDSLYGELHKFVLNYYLADQTIQVNERLPPNSGHDNFPCFLKKQKIARDNVFSISTRGVGAPVGEGENFVSDRDLRIGSFVVIYDRPLLLVDCDDFTKQYYTHNYGITDFTPLDVDEDKQKRPSRKVAPPQTGIMAIGSEEDSVGNCMYLVLKPPKKDLKKQMALEKDVCRFEAVLQTKNPEDKDRKFIISYYCGTDEIAIFEPSIRNSGIIGGKLLARTRVRKPGPGEAKYYKLDDLRPGKSISAVGQTFVVTNMEERARKILDGEKTRKDLTNQEIVQILNKIRDSIMLKHVDLHIAFFKIDSARTGSISLVDFKRMLDSFQLSSLSDGEVAQLLSYMDSDGSGTIDYEEFLAKIDQRSVLATGEDKLEEVESKEELHKKFVQAQMEKERRRFREKVFNAFRRKLIENRRTEELFLMLSQANGESAIVTPSDIRRASELLKLNFSELELQGLIECFFSEKEALDLVNFIDIVESPQGWQFITKH